MTTCPAGSVALTITGAPTPTGISAVSAVTDPPGHVQVAVARGSSRTVAVVDDDVSRTMWCWPCWVGVTVTVSLAAPVVAAAARRRAVKVRAVSFDAPSRAVTVMLIVPLGGVVIDTRSSDVLTPPTVAETVIGASPPAVSMNMVVCSGSSAVATPGSPMYSPVGV